MGPVSPLGPATAVSEYSPSKFFQTGLVAPFSVVTSEEDSDWWVSLQGCGQVAALAIAILVGGQTAQAIAACDRPQDEVPRAPAHEEYWQNPIAPILGNNLPLYLPDPEEIPAGSLTATVDEYYWQNPVPPVWNYPVFTFPATDEIVPQPVSFQPDEDYWQNQVVPFVAPIQVPASWVFSEETPFLFGQFDEDFWVNPVAPLTWPIQQPPFADEQIFPQATPLGLDEDFWQNPVIPVVVSMVPYWAWSFDESAIVPQPAPGTQNYVDSGFNNFISQQVNTGVRF